jgi:hypothetical protein
VDVRGRSKLRWMAFSRHRSLTEFSPKHQSLRDGAPRWR